MKTKKQLYTHFIRNSLLVLTSLCIVFAGILFVWIGSITIPDFKSFETRKITNSTKIYDRTGTVLLYDVHADVKRTVISYDEMGTNIKNATVAIEDAQFFEHKGIRPTSIIRAVLTNLIHGKLSQGGSTLTQQVVKNTLLTKDKTITRKMKEWVLSIKLEKAMSKEDILALYLNEAPYGGTVYGIKEGARMYFKKEPKDLTLAEAAYLAAIPQSPSFYSPYGKNKEKLSDRKNLVLSRMKELNFITEEQYMAAKNETVVFSQEQRNSIQAPHFVFFVRDYLEQKYGENAVEEGGFSVITTLDADLQKKAEQVVKDGALKNEKDFNGKNAALVAIDPKTGQILSMVGSRDYFDKQIDGNFNVATAKRQPGSSFKPFIYETAFEMGYTPNTVLFDVPTEFSGACNAYGNPLPGNKKTDCYMPDNYDNLTKGPISLRSALAESRNIPAVKLLYLVGIDNAIKRARDIGITTLTDKNQYGLTLVIGGGEVSLLDMTSAYSVFANNGVRNPYTGILKVTDSNNIVREEYTPNPRTILDKNSTLLLSDVLSDNTARIPTFGANSTLYFPGYQVAAKSGTTNNNKDAWLMGYTPSIAVGVWAGNNENTPMKKGGSALAGPLFKSFMSYALTKSPKENFETPITPSNNPSIPPVVRGDWKGGESFVIDSISGKLATEQTPQETREEKVITNVQSILYWINKTNPTQRKENPGDSDSQFDRWNIPIQNWWNQNKYKYQIVYPSQKPTSYDDVHTENRKPILSIDTSSSSFPVNQPIIFTITSSGFYPLKQVDVFLGDTYIDTISRAPFTSSFVPSDNTIEKGETTLRIIGTDSVYNKKELSLPITLY